MISSDDDLVGIDVARYARVLLRRWYVIVAATIIGGALGWAIARMQPPVYLGTTRLMIMAAGSGTAADAVVKYQGALETDAVLDAAIAAVKQDNPAADVTRPALRQALSSRLGFPANSYIVDVRWHDADMASKLARAIAEAALVTVRDQHVKQLHATRELMRGEVEKTNQALQKARDALAKFRAANAADLTRVKVDNVSQFVADLQYLVGEIPSERARLAVMEKDLAEMPAKAAESKEPDYRNALLNRILESRARIAGMEAKRAVLQKEIQEHERQAERLKRVIAIEQRQNELVADLNRAEKDQNLVDQNASLATDDGVALINTLQLIEAPLTPGRPLTNRATGLPRGMATGFVLSVFGILFLRGFWGPPRTA